jgi:hypothetical protein
MTRRLSRAASPDETLHDQFASPKVQIQWISKRPMHELASKYIEVCNSSWYIRSPNPSTKMSWWIRSISDKDTEELVMQRAVCVDILSTIMQSTVATLHHRDRWHPPLLLRLRPGHANRRAHHGGDTLDSRRRRSTVTCIWDEPPNLATTRALYWSIWVCG